jgi:transposase
MYKKVEKVFEIYDSNYTVQQAKDEFNKWFKDVSKLDFITELQNTGRMIKNHFDRILNYFDGRLTNGYAE